MHATPRDAVVLVGLCGPSGSGKDTLADALMARSGGSKTAFAEPLKTACKALFGLTDHQLHDPVAKNVTVDLWGRSPRDLLQIVGTDLLREQLDGEVFLKSMRARIAAASGVMFVTDCRFENEAELVRHAGGQIIHLYRAAATPLATTHVTEQRLSVKPGDVVLHNDGTVADLVRQAEVILAQHGTRRGQALGGQFQSLLCPTNGNGNGRADALGRQENNLQE